MNDVLTLPREDCVRLLEAAGIRCYDHEPVHVLREAVEANLGDGTIDPADLG